MEEKLKQYVTHEKFNTVVYELKTEIRETQVASDKMYTELKHSNSTLNNTLSNLNNTISELNSVMIGMREDSKEMKNEILGIEKENITRDNRVRDLEEFQETAEKHISGRLKEVVGLILGLGSIAATIVVAIIQLAPLFF